MKIRLTSPQPPGYGPAKAADSFIPDGHPTRTGGHHGWDYRKKDGSNADIGTPIYAAAPGQIAAAGLLNTTCGNGVRINHGNGWLTSYCHMSKVLAERFEQIRRGEIIGEVGKSGNAGYPHLHFSIQLHTLYLDPALMLEPEIPADPTKGIIDAMVSGQLKDGPILLVDPKNLGETATAINAIRPALVMLLGGTAAISAEVVQELKARGYNVARLAGDNRYETAVKIAQRAFPNGAPVVYLAAGRSLDQ